MNMCIKDAPAARDVEQLDMYKQLTANRRKEDILCDNRILDDSENTLMHYIPMRCFILLRVLTLLLWLTGR